MSMAETVAGVHAPRKTELVSEIRELANSYKTVGITRLSGISSSVLANIRKALRGTTVIKVAKNTLKRLALEEVINARPELEKVRPYLRDSIALIFSNENPFKLMKFFDRNRVDVAAKPGQIVQQEVWVSAGPTDFNPGPVISEFNSIGIKTSVQQGKVNIQKDVKILSPGDTVSDAQASIMSKLGLKPIRIGISLNFVVSEEGILYKEQDLLVDDTAILGQLKTAHQHALNLTIKLGIPTKENIRILLNSRNQAARNLALKIGYISKDTIGPLLAKANSQAMALSGLVKI